MNNASERAVVAALTAKDDMSEEIIYSTEVIEQEVEETVEVMEEEVVEIVEITVEEADETVEEEEILNEAVVTTSTPSTTTTTTTTAATAFSAQELEETENSPHANYSEIREDSESLNDSTQEDDPGVVPQRFKSASQYKVERGLSRRGYESSKRVVNYDADEDWEDEENEQHHQISESRGSRSGRSGAVVSSSQPRKNHSLNGKRTSNARGDDYSSSSNRSNAEPAYKIAKTRASSDYADARNCGNTNDMEEMEEEEEEEEEEEDEEEENQHEIVKSAENNLVYTVLGSKKSTSSGGKSKRESALSQSQQDASYMKMERVDEDTIPVEGTIYYEGDNMETVYLAQSGNEGTEEYQYEGQTDEQEEQGWETANEATGEEHEEEEDVQQDQIFLHEDENGQLYFKDDNGELQPVYLTADGNYAIAENNGEEQEAHENANNRQQPSPSSSTGAQVAKSFEEDSFIVPELEGVASGSNANDPDNEDNNTVTISLIISEDENGQKRTQVIIPTTDNLKCELCAKSFKTPFQLLRHNRLKHAREEDITTRNFPCDLCPKRYSDQNTLARHRKTHIGDRPFGCLECGKSFPTSTALRRHLTQHNPQSRPLPCIYCGRRFLEKSALTKHEQSHLAGDQRTHTCDICHKSFLQAADLNAHKKNHDPDKKFDCEVCGREFNRLNNLQRHMMVHKQKQGQNQEILACDVCGITYKFMSSLTRHMVTSHMNPEKLRQQAEEQRKKRENNYRRYLENRKMYETQHTGSGFASTGKRAGSGGYRSSNDNDEDTA